MVPLAEKQRQSLVFIKKLLVLKQISGYMLFAKRHLVIKRIYEKPAKLVMHMFGFGTEAMLETRILG